MFDAEQVRTDFDRIAALPPGGPDHNRLYHPYLLRRLPRRFGRALDVGCGAGAFALLLAERAEHVDALDLSPGMIAAARRHASGRRNIHFEVADFLERPLAPEGYDVVATLATLHHGPLVPALERLAAALRPGGVLVVHDLLDTTGWGELPRNALAWTVARFLAHWGPRATREGRRAWAEHGKRDRYDSWASIVRTYRAALPGAVLRHHVLWRYSAVWRKPPSQRSSLAEMSSRA